MGTPLCDNPTLQACKINTFLIFDTHLRGAIDKTVSPTLMNKLQAFPLLRHKIQTFSIVFNINLFKTNMPT
jgi:hypothetical protein